MKKLLLLILIALALSSCSKKDDLYGQEDIINIGGEKNSVERPLRFDLKMKGDEDYEYAFKKIRDSLENLESFYLVYEGPEGDKALLLDKKGDRSAIADSHSLFIREKNKNTTKVKGQDPIIYEGERNNYQNYRTLLYELPGPMAINHGGADGVEARYDLIKEDGREYLSIEGNRKISEEDKKDGDFDPWTSFSCLIDLDTGLAQEATYFDDSGKVLYSYRLKTFDQDNLDTYFENIKKELESDA